MERGAIHLRLADLFAIGGPLGFGLATLLRAGGQPDHLKSALLLFLLAAGGLALRWWATWSDSTLAQLCGGYYVMLNITGTYSNLNPLINAVSPVTFDRELQWLDQALLGAQASVWLERFHHPLLTEISLLAYTSYFAWQLSLAVIAYLRNNGDFDDICLTVTGFYMMSYVGYTLIPAIGPRFDISHAFSVPLHGVFVGDAIRDSFNDIPMVRDCFPSGHTGLTILVFVRAIQKRATTFAWIMGPWAALLIFSTVYCRFHYLTDLLCALPWIFGVLALEEALRNAFPQGVTLRLPAPALARPSRAAPEAHGASARDPQPPEGRRS